METVFTQGTARNLDGVGEVPGNGWANVITGGENHADEQWFTAIVIQLYRLALAVGQLKICQGFTDGCLRYGQRLVGIIGDELFSLDTVVEKKA
jgi:hypothetical protein